MSFFYNWYKNELPIVIKAWKSFILTAILFLSFGLVASIWHYNETINVKSERITSLNEEIRAKEFIILSNIKNEINEFNKNYEKNLNEIKENYKTDKTKTRLYWGKNAGLFSNQISKSYILNANKYIKQIDSLFGDLIINSNLELAEEISETNKLFNISNETRKYFEKEIVEFKKMK